MIPDFSKAARLAVTLAAAAVSALLLAGCYDDYLAHRDTISLTAGDAIATNAATQTIDPWPAHAKDTVIDQDGKRAQIAMERYQKNKSIPPQGLNTTDIISQSGPGKQSNTQVTN
jgi:hypothetical protein